MSGELLALAPDVLVVVAYGRLLPGRILNAAPRGAVNVHFSLLPLYRGAAPVQWALARGEAITGVTTMQIVRRLDAGDILLQREVPIEPGEHAPALQARLAVAGAELLVETLARLAAGTLTPRPQDESRATHAPPLLAEDAAIDPGLEASQIEGRVRGFDPWPGAWLTLGGRRLRIVEARAIPGASAGGAPVGTLVPLPDGRFALSCAADTLLQLLRVQPDGRREMAIEAAVNGRYFNV